MEQATFSSMEQKHHRLLLTISSLILWCLQPTIIRTIFNCNFYVKGLRDLKISTVKPSLLAAAYNSGTVAAWNTVSKTNNSPLVEFSNVHQSPATCIALSPVTDILMVSGGLDKNIVLYDFLKKKWVWKFFVLVDIALLLCCLNWFFPTLFARN